MLLAGCGSAARTATLYGCPYPDVRAYAFAVGRYGSRARSKSETWIGKKDQKRF